MTNKRDRIIALVRQLREKTIDRGCTEAEALSAAEKVSQLMAEYQLSLTDINEVKDDVYGAMSKSYAGGSGTRRTWHETKFTWMAIADFCDCECWTAEDKLIFFGSRNDCEISFYMVDLIKNTADSEWKLYQSKIRKGRQSGYTDRTARAAFMAGFSSRISARLRDLKLMREAKTQATEQSRALVVVKKQVVAAKFDAYTKQQGLKLRTTKVRRRSRDGQAYMAGQSAGEKANLGSGITGTKQGGYLK